MSPVLEAFPDVERVVTDLLSPLCPVYTEFPADFAAPAIRVQRTGGSDDGITDSPFVEVMSVGRTRAEAWELDGAVRQYVLASGGTLVNGVLVDSARTMTPPQQMPDPRTNVRVVSSSYRMGFRRPPTVSG